jgi:hypothetical protein
VGLEVNDLGSAWPPQLLSCPGPNARRAFGHQRRTGVANATGTTAINRLKVKLQQSTLVV